MIPGSIVRKSNGTGSEDQIQRRTVRKPNEKAGDNWVQACFIRSTNETWPNPRVRVRIVRAPAGTSTRPAAYAEPWARPARDIPHMRNPGWSRRDTPHMRNQRETFRICGTGARPSAYGEPARDLPRREPSPSKRSRQAEAPSPALLTTLYAAFATPIRSRQVSLRAARTVFGRSGLSDPGLP